MPKNNELGLTGPGVEPLEIPELDRAISKYQKKKALRCEASPEEISAKKEVRLLLHKHKDSLPLNEDGIPFYRSDERDYVLDEKLIIRKVVQEEDEE
jgi:hypothetical protein